MSKTKVSRVSITDKAIGKKIGQRFDGPSCPYSIYENDYLYSCMATLKSCKYLCQSIPACRVRAHIICSKRFSAIDVWDCFTCWWKVALKRSLLVKRHTVATLLINNSTFLSSLYLVLLPCLACLAVFSPCKLYVVTLY